MYFIEVPWQVASAGIWYRVSESSSMAKQLKYIDDIITSVIKELPKYDCFRITFGANLWTWQPFYWAGFKATPCYTMLIEDILPEQMIKSITSSRRNIVRRKDDYRFVDDELGPEDAFQFIESCYKQRGKKLTYSKERFLKLLYSLREHDAVKIRSLYNGDEIAAVNILFGDKERNYNHFVVHSVKAQDSGTKIIFDSILCTMAEAKTFDFEGSMIQDNCRFYSSFNPKWEIKYVIENFSNRYIIMQSLRTIVIAIKTSIASQFGRCKNV